MDGEGDSSSEHSRVIFIHSKADYDQQLLDATTASRMVVLIFSASWCSHSKRMEPQLNHLSVKFSNLGFFKIDVDECQEICKEWNLEAMPTFVFVKDGKEVDKIVGAKNVDLGIKVKKYHGDLLNNRGN